MRAPVFLGSPAWLVWASLSALSCSLPAVPPVDREQSAVVYGTDDRADLYEVVDPSIRQLAIRAVVAIVPEASLSDGRVSATLAPRAKQVWNLCPGERFEDQPALARCSGTLISDDLVLTAGHCFVDEEHCRSTAFVFDFFLERPGDLAPSAPDAIHHCSRLVVHHRPRPEQDYALDYAIVELDRTVSANRSRAPLRIDLDPAASYTLIAHGMGLPGKVHRGIHVIDPLSATDGYFIADADAFAGGSGGGLFDEHGQLVGFAMRGQPDFDSTAKRCSVVRTLEPTCPDCPERGERLAYVLPALRALCARPAERHAALCEGIPSQEETPVPACNMHPTSGAVGGAIWSAFMVLVGCARRLRRRRLADA